MIALHSDSILNQYRKTRREAVDLHHHPSGDPPAPKVSEFIQYFLLFHKTKDHSFQFSTRYELKKTENIAGQCFSNELSMKLDLVRSQ